jgi:hypothetical protein
MAVDFNEAFFERLSKSAPVQELLVSVAEDLAERARDSAPVDTGAYKKSIHVETKFQRRAVALVVAGDKKSMIIEAKTGNLVRALNSKKKSHRG